MSPLPPITTIFMPNLLVCRPQVWAEFATAVNLRHSCALRRRKLKFSSGAGGRDFISRKAVLPAPSAATAGLAVFFGAIVWYPFHPPRVFLISPQGYAMWAGVERAGAPAT